MSRSWCCCVGAELFVTINQQKSSTFSSILCKLLCYVLIFLYFTIFYTFYCICENFHDISIIFIIFIIFMILLLNKKSINHKSMRFEVSIVLHPPFLSTCSCILVKLTFFFCLMLFIVYVYILNNFPCRMMQCSVLSCLVVVDQLICAT